jgi:hypothetical protein
MFSKNYIFKILVVKVILVISLLSLTNCSVPKFMKPTKQDSSSPVNARERARENVNTGKGISLKGLAKDVDQQIISLALLILCGVLLWKF